LKYDFVQVNPGTFTSLEVFYLPKQAKTQQHKAKARAKDYTQKCAKVPRKHNSKTKEIVMLNMTTMGTLSRQRTSSFSCNASRTMANC